MACLNFSLKSLQIRKQLLHEQNISLILEFHKYIFHIFYGETTNKKNALTLDIL